MTHPKFGVLRWRSLDAVGGDKRKGDLSEELKCAGSDDNFFLALSYLSVVQKWESGELSLYDDLTAMILTYNEEDNIRRTLDAVSWVPHIVVVDSGSSDGTLEIVRGYKQAKVVTRKFDNFANQCNFGLEVVDTSWVLSLDADYELSGAIAREIQGLSENTDINGYRTTFVYRIYGYPLRGALYPARTVLYRKNAARYEQEGHGHRVVIRGRTADLGGRIFHDDRKTLSRWLSSQQSYAKLEADYLLSRDVSTLSRSDRIRLMSWSAPILVFCYTLFLKGCLFDGWPGWLYVLQRTLAETMIALEIVDRRLRVRRH